MKTLMDILKSSMTSLYESLLDDEEELLGKLDIKLQLFNNIFYAKNKNDFYKNIDILCDMCDVVDINDDLSKYKDSVFVMKMYAKSSRKKPYGMRLEKYFIKTKKPLFINFISAGKMDITMLNTKTTFHELRNENVLGLKDDIVYVMPKDLEKTFVEWLQHPKQETYLSNVGIQGFKYDYKKIV